jgi:hypothetical protein
MCMNDVVRSVKTKGLIPGYSNCGVIFCHGKSVLLCHGIFVSLCGGISVSLSRGKIVLLSRGIK